MSWYFGTNLLIRIMAGLVLGAVVGIFMAFSASPETVASFVGYTKFFGDIFVNLLKMIVVPVIFLSLIAGAASITPGQLGRVGLKTLLYYLITSIISISIGLTVALLLQPGVGLGITGAEGIAGKAATAPPLSTVLLNIVPTNIIASLSKGDVLPIIFFALVFGISLAILRDNKDDHVSKYATMLYNLIATAAETMYLIVRGIMQYAPIGVFVLISVVFAQQGPKVIGPLVFLTLCVYLGLVLHLFVGYGAVLGVFKLSIFNFLRKGNEPPIMAFVTRSSSATLPVTMRVTEENLGVPRSISSFALPIGATVNMDGTAIYLAICTVFIGNAVGMPLQFDQLVTLTVVATLAAIGAAGVPGAGALMMLMVLEAIGMPVEAGSAVAAAYAMILGMDALFDMGRTCLNVTGDMIGVIAVSKSEGQLDTSKWQLPA
ncbi:dicarboxylate/amino acid:cation symporter [Desulfovibrio sp. OttesenSCG-928-I05]|nr:dicarboxylate/amino acid:cation symporter [Desulfovibrio sp. OttesenSCG-928-I05]